MIKCHGIAHVTLTVSDPQKTKSFYEKVFGTALEMDDEYSFSLQKVGVPCWFVKRKRPIAGDRFDEKRIGLDHIAFEINSIQELAQIAQRLKEIKVRSKGVEKFVGKYPYIAFRDPDNIQTEFFISSLS